MNTLTFEVPEEQAGLLEEAARSDGIPVEGLLRKLAGDYLARRAVKAPRFTLAELVAGITDENRHPEVDTGPAMGNEVW